MNVVGVSVNAYRSKANWIGSKPTSRSPTTGHGGGTNRRSVRYVRTALPTPSSALPAPRITDDGPPMLSNSASQRENPGGRRALKCSRLWVSRNLSPLAM